MSDFKEALDSIRSTIAFDARDWSVDRRDAWLYAILVGWDDALDEVADKHGWDADSRTRLREYGKSVNEASELQGRIDAAIVASEEGKCKDAIQDMLWILRGEADASELAAMLDPTVRNVDVVCSNLDCGIVFVTGADQYGNCPRCGSPRKADD